MAWPKQKKQETKQRILESAADLFTRRGFDDVSITDVMQHAKLTHGGFYTHFTSKQALYAEAIQVAARKSIFYKMPNEQHQPMNNDALLLHLLEAYLSHEHLLSEHPSCPLAFLVTDVSHQKAEVRESYTKIYKQLTGLLNKLMDEDRGSDKALAMSAMMIGGLAIANTLSDSTMTDRLLNACRKECENLVKR